MVEKGTFGNEVALSWKRDEFYLQHAVRPDVAVINNPSPQVSKRFVGKDFAQLIHNEAKPFIDWLENAEEESEDEDSAEGEFHSRRGWLTLPSDNNELSVVRCAKRANIRVSRIADAVEIEYDDRHTAEGLREVKETTPKPNGNSVNNNGKAPPPEEDDGDDLDIDDI